MLIRTKVSPRIAIYTQDGLGLGHLRRNSLIGQQLLARLPHCSVLLFTDSPVAPFFSLPEGMDHVKLPSILKIRAGHWRPTRLPIQINHVQQLRQGLLRQALLDYWPDLVLVDHMPQGAQGELIPVLQALKEMQPHCRLVLGLRDILDLPEVIARVWQSEGAYDALRQWYDGVLIYGGAEVFDTARTYQLDSFLPGVQYCGYVVNLNPPQSASSVRQRVRAIDRKFVFVSAGGGHDGEFLMRTYIQAIRLLGGRADFATVMAAGATAPRETRRVLGEQAQGLPIQVVPFVEDSLSYIAAADLVVSMAGYNTMSEVVHLRKKALVVPRAGPSSEQRMRARLLQQRNLIDVITPEELAPDILAERLLADLERNDYPSSHQVLDTKGGERAATFLLQAIGAERYEAAMVGQ